MQHCLLALYPLHSTCGAIRTVDCKLLLLHLNWSRLGCLSVCFLLLLLMYRQCLVSICIIPHGGCRWVTSLHLYGSFSYCRLLGSVTCSTILLKETCMLNANTNLQRWDFAPAHSKSLIAFSTFHFGSVGLSTACRLIIALTSIPLKLCYRDFIPCLVQGCNTLVVFASKNINSLFQSSTEECAGQWSVNKIIFLLWAPFSHSLMSSLLFWFIHKDREEFCCPWSNKATVTSG
jgi:hypothetical protein